MASSSPRGQLEQETQEQLFDRMQEGAPSGLKYYIPLARVTSGTECFVRRCVFLLGLMHFQLY